MNKKNYSFLLKGILLTAALCWAICMQGRRHPDASRLVGMLQEMQAGEEMTPDNFYADVVQLRSAIEETSDEAARAIYKATLAHLVSINAFRAQTQHLGTPSHPDSLQEWSREEYFRYAATLYGEALRTPALLHTQQTKAWMPLANRGKDERVYDSDMLYVVWTAMRNDLPEETLKQPHMPQWSDLIAFYRSCHLDEAALWMAIDSMDARPTMKDPHTQWKQIIKDYGHLQDCAEVYLRLSRLSESKPEESRKWLEEGLQRYPKSNRSNALKNALLNLQHPVLGWDYHSYYAPHTSVAWPLRTRNVSQVSFTLYALPSDFDENQENVEAALRKRGQKIRVLNHTLRQADPFTTLSDTLRWTTPGYGRYAMVATAKSNGRIRGKTEPTVCFFRVSSMAFIAFNLPGNRLRLKVVDITTGAPKSGVNVAFTHYRDRDTTTLQTAVTSARGDVEIGLPDRQQVPTHVRLWQGADSAMEAERVYSYYSILKTATNTKVETIRLYTDRSIYRPGQKIHAAALAFATTPNGAHTTKGKKLTLTYHDANNQLMGTHDITTDSMGMAVDSLQLPEGQLPGLFSIRVKGAGSSCTFRVEEYKRATFQVDVQQETHTPWPARHITLQGKALTYNGVPVTDARVCLRYRWQERGWPRIYVEESDAWKEGDTLYTDAEGRFTVKVDVPRTQGDDKHAISMLQTEIDVLSRQGETCTTTHHITLHHTPLRLMLQTGALLDKDRLKPWTIQLIDCCSQPVAGSVECKLLKDGKPVFTTRLEAGKAVVPQGLRNVPSGKYILHAFGQAGTDTVSVRQEVSLLSMNDTEPLPETPLHIYCPNPTFTSTRPATIRLATSLPEAYVWCMAVSKNTVVKDTLIRLAREVRTMEQPFQTGCEEGITMMYRMIQGGKAHTSTLTLLPEQANRKLAWKWDTFRDRLEPGQQEEWRMTLLTADGKPASANVMCTLFDAALDALQPHALRLAIPKITGAPTLHGNVGIHQPRFAGLDFTTRQYPDTYPQWSRLNDALFFHYQADTGIPRPLMARNTRTGVMSGQRMMAKATATATAASKSDLVFDCLETEACEDAAPAADTYSAAGGKEAAPLAGWVRTNLQELAFFYPTLRTDAQGQVSLSFTLPEGLTAWHLMGMAHTADMQTVTFEDTIQAVKRVMAQLQLPRFLRSGDKATLTATVRNRTAEEMKGEAILEITDATTSRLIDIRRIPLQLTAMQDTVVHLPYTATDKHPMLVVRWMARTDTGSDGEQQYLPVLSDVEEVTETKSFCITGSQQWQADLDKLFAYNHPEAAHRRLTVEYTSRPVWMAIRALPVLHKPKANDVLSLAASYYADAMAHHTLQRIPQLQEAIRQWSAADRQMSSTLKMNESLTGMGTAQTPWMDDAVRDSLQRHALLELYRTAPQPQTRLAAIEAIARLQLPDGSFAWYPGMKGDAYLTAEVVRLLTRLRIVAGNDAADAATQQEEKVFGYAMDYLSDQAIKWLKDNQENRTHAVVLQYLYALSRSSYKPHDTARRAVKEWVDKLQETAPDLPYEQRAMATIVLHAQGEKRKAQQIAEKLRTLVMQADGYHLAYPGGRLTSIDRKIQQHVALMEAFGIVFPQDKKLMEGMEQWLVMQKRAQTWEQPVQTADAVYMIMLHHAVPFSEQTADRLVVKGKNRQQILQSDADYLGYVRTEVDVPQPKTIQVDKHSQGTSWGTVYAQYTLPYSALQAQREGITLRRDVAKAGWNEGDRVHVRYTLTIDHDMEYVVLQASRIAAAQPAVQHSGYSVVNGVGCYRAVHDTGNAYFFDALPRGTYVIEEDWLLDRPGDYQLGTARLQCVYAPAFQAHTQGETIHVTERKHNTTHQ